MSDQQTRSRRRADRGRSPSPETLAEPQTAGGSPAHRSPPVAPTPAVDAGEAGEHAEAVDAIGAADGQAATDASAASAEPAAVDTTAVDATAVPALAVPAPSVTEAAVPATAEADARDAEAIRRHREGSGEAREIPWHLRPWKDEDGAASGSGQASGVGGGPNEGPGGDGRGHPSWPPEVQPHHHAWVYAVVAVFLLALGFGGWGLWTVFRPVESLGGDLPAQNERLRQEISTLRRSDQISREANRDLQRTLAERDEEIAGLRADVAFYERFVGATGQRRGLSVHELKLQPEREDAWRFVATLTQNLNRGATNSGRLTVSVEGMRAGRLQRLAWSELRQQTAEPGLEYSFKYFQQVEGNLILPAGFEPLRLTVRLVPEGGSAVEQSFPWADVAAAPRAQDSALR